MTGPAETPDPRAPLDRLAAITANRIGCFEWVPADGRFTLDDTGLAVFDLRPEEYEGTIASLNQRMPVEEVMRMHRLLEDIRAGRSESYSSYVRIRLRDGATRWTYVQGQAVHDPGLRVLGVVRDATTELAHSAMRLMGRTTGSVSRPPCARWSTRSARRSPWPTWSPCSPATRAGAGSVPRGSAWGGGPRAAADDRRDRAAPDRGPGDAPRPAHRPVAAQRRGALR
ncbi:PAS domain-containing protein [Kitasatospora acidiphila]|uniref:PAS domain-containing protein n=1 Tax=Kitasatospora acidiphila TaxID=2567942 RepID=A0A540WC02_9ACTN|nr:PAS domain-containing protein [Kitasatospora acidiphila]TQF06569.1 PAS domain-containing protein [Kitasatospora acidiphila]